MIPTFRWFGAADPIPLAHIRQIPGVTGVVSALYDVPVGDAWTRARLGALKAQIEEAGLCFAVVESIAVHEDIKLGRPGRDRLIDHYSASIASMGELGIPVLCYNFMPVFDWTRTDLAMRLPDGSTALAYDDRALAAIDLSRGTGELPGWATAYQPAELQALLAAYRDVDAERLRDNLAHFLERVVPVAGQARVRPAIHPDAPPWIRAVRSGARRHLPAGSLGSALPERRVSTAVAPRRIGYRWTVCALLFAVTTINYVDRQVLGILAPTLQRELGWSEAAYGDVVSWFSLPYALAFLAAGRLFDRIGVRRGFAAAVVAWSLAAIAHAFARTTAR